MAKLKRIAEVLVAIMALLCLQIGVVGCRKEPKAKNAFFSDETAQTFTFDGDKALEEDLTIGRAVSFDLKNYSFDLNGYTLTVQSDAADCLVEFKDGAIKNGTLSFEELTKSTGDATGAVERTYEQTQDAFD